MSIIDSVLAAATFIGFVCILCIIIGCVCVLCIMIMDLRDLRQALKDDERKDAGE